MNFRGREVVEEQNTLNLFIMSLKKGCTCPLSASLTDITQDACPLNIGQIQKIYFQRTPYTWDGTDITLKADWDTLRTAGDDTKVVVSPLIGGDPVIEAGEAITIGGNDNTTRSGVELVTGAGPSNFSARFDSLSPKAEREMKQFICEGKLGVYFVTEDQKIWCWVDDPDAATPKEQPIPVESAFFTDRNNGGFGTLDSNILSFKLRKGWSECLVQITPADFNPLVDLDS